MAAAEKEEYIFYRVGPEHYPALITLYAETFGSRLTIASLGKRYATSALGAPHIGFMAIHQESGAAAAYYGVFPHQIIRGEDIMTVAQSGDTMTHPAHRKKGLFIRLAKMTYAACEAAGIRYIYGFPNENSLPGFLKHLDWKQTDEVVRYDLKLRFKTFPLSRLAARYPFFRNLQLWLARRVLHPLRVNRPEEFTSLLAPGYFRVYRDRHYLDYKSSPETFFIQTDNVICWIRLTDVFWVGEVSDYSALSPAVLRRLKRLAFLSGFNTIVFHLNKSVPLPATLAGTKKAGSDLLCFYLPHPKQPVPLLLTGADFDTW